VSDVVGSILLVAITVLMMVGLSVVVLSMDGPARSPQALLVPSAHPGPDNDWGTADDYLLLSHKGGEHVPREGTTIIVQVDATTSRYEPSALDGGFADGRLTIGETWTRTGALGLGARIGFDVAYEGQASSLVASSVLRVPTTQPDLCASDTLAPTVGTWTQTPPDVNASTVGGVTVRVEVIDNCSGVDATAAPHLHSRAAGASPPAFTDHGAMTHVSGSTWEGTVPDPTWSAQVGKTLQYYVSGLTDLKGNSGDSQVREDFIQLAGTQTYVTAYGPDTGTVSSFGNMQSGSDSGAAATLREASSGGGPGTASIDADGATQPNGWSDTGNAGASDDQYVTQSGNSPGFVEFSLADPTASGAITQVVLKAEVKASKSSSNWYLQACNTAACSAQSGSLGSPTADTTLSYDVSAASLRPGGTGAWQWSDITDLRVRVHADGAGNPLFSIDRVWAEVQHDGTTYRMEIDLDIGGVPVGVDHTIEMRYETFGDTFSFQVWDGASWNTRATLDSLGTMSTLTYALTVAEYNSGSVMTRVIDGTAGGTQGEVRIDYLRVVTS